MTSASAHPAVVDLSPEQRQALFDKLRQRKLAQARLPTTIAPVQEPSRRWCWSPLQAACPAPGHNRLLRITLHGTADLTQLAHHYDQLLQHHEVLRVALGADGNYLPLTTGAPLRCLPSTRADRWPSLLAELAQPQPERPCLQAVAAHQADGHTQLLLAAHPLLLDQGSLLTLACQWLDLYSGRRTPEQIVPTTFDCQQRFRHWSAQVLEHRFLNQEWQRLRPRDTLTHVDIGSSTLSQRVQHELDLAFINSHLPAGQSRKAWLLDALHQCLQAAAGPSATLFWLASPALRDHRFEQQLGFFPHYLPVSRTLDDNSAATMPLQRWQNRFTPVSEQMARHLCQYGSQAPLVHYHSIDAEGLAALAVDHPGLMRSALEIHLIDQCDRIRLDLHFQPERLQVGQVQALLQRFVQHLAQQEPATSVPRLQDQLRTLWQALLQKSDIGDDDSFFELGGHSLQVTELKFRLRQQLKLDIPVAVLYELTTINQLAHFIVASHGNSLGLGDETGRSEEEEGTL